MEWVVPILILPYLVLMLWYFRGLTKKLPCLPEENKTYPYISVVVAARNEENNINGLAEALLCQDYPKDRYEIIIVNDNSTDATVAILKTSGARDKVRVIDSAGSGKKAAIRLGIQEAAGELILTTDADCRPTEKWISAFASCYLKQQPDMIIGPVEIEPSTGIAGRFEQIEFLALQGITAGSAINGHPLMCNGANLFFTREAYFSCADELHPEIHSGDDIYLLHCLKRQKNRKILWMTPGEATVITRKSPDAASFIRQRVRWISKAGTYTDVITNLTAIVTFVTISAIILPGIMAVLGIFDPWKVLAAFLIKSIPDYLIISRMTELFNRKNLLICFFPAGLIYPFYVALVSGIMIIIKISYPFRRGT